MTKQKADNGWPPSRFGEALKRERARAGMSQQALADAAGCHKFTVSKLERGAQEPAWQLVLALARALGCGVEAFVVVDAEAETKES